MISSVVDDFHAGRVVLVVDNSNIKMMLGCAASVLRGIKSTDGAGLDGRSGGFREWIPKTWHAGETGSSAEDHEAIEWKDGMEVSLDQNLENDDTVHANQS